MKVPVIPVFGIQLLADNIALQAEKAELMSKLYDLDSSYGANEREVARVAGEAQAFARAEKQINEFINGVSGQVVHEQDT